MPRRRVFPVVLGAGRVYAAVERRIERRIGNATLGVGVLFPANALAVVAGRGD